LILTVHQLNIQLGNLFVTGFRLLLTPSVQPVSQGGPQSLEFPRPEESVHLGLLRRHQNTGENEPNWVTLYAYMEMSQQTPLYNYYILIKNI
jgi:hypothetical protein